MCYQEDGGSQRRSIVWVVSETGCSASLYEDLLKNTASVDLLDVHVTALPSLKS